jgi:hypothetical protein
MSLCCFFVLSDVYDPCWFTLCLTCYIVFEAEVVVSRFYLQRVDSFSGRNKLCLQKWPRFLEDVFIRFSNSRGSWRFHGVRVNRCTIPVSMSALMWGLMQILSVYFFVWSVCHTRCCCCLYGDPRCERLRSISFSSEETCYSCSSPSRCIWLKAFPSHGI